MFMVGILCLLGAAQLIAQKSIIQEENRKIKTYPFSDPDPVPILVSRPAIYPYFAFNKYSHTGKDQIWKVVRLENDYIRVLVLPEVGGKVYGAVEKSTQNEFIYLNDVMKFRQIAMRGPWTSGGIEFNFGIVGHTPAVATPVDYILRENADGSVSCFVGTYDWTSRTRWSVEINLPKDKAYFQTQTLWYNPSPFHQSYYSWSNNAVLARNDLQYFYPGRFRRPHGADAPMAPWPVDEEGRDLSWYRNNDFGSHKSHFVMGEYKNFYGGYWHDDAFGFGHYALYDDMPGKKMWIWSLAGDGAIWENLLTDSDGQYSEPQAGRYFSQDDHEFFTPYTADLWREIIFPFKDIGGLASASPYGAMNVARQGNALTVSICALQAIDDDLTISIGGEKIDEERLRLSPMEVYIKNLTLPARVGVLEVTVGEKIAYTDDPQKSDIHRPIQYRRIDESTTEGLYLSGEFHEKRRDYETALKKYEACLEKDAQHIRALTRIAELYCRRTEYKNGLEYAARALALNMYDPSANYAYGILSRRLSNLIDAKETLGWAARSMEYRSNAYCQLAEIHLLENNLDTAREYAERSLKFNTFNLRAYELLAILHRKQSAPDEAEKILSRLFEIDPLNHLIRFERYLWEPTPEKLESFKSMIRTELPHEQVLEMAVSYANLGLDDEAVTILKQATPHPTLLYWLAYFLREKAPDQSRIYLEQAGNLSPRLVFPFREETIPILRWAVQTHPENWKPKYYLGLILWGKGRLEEAHRLFDACGDPQFAPFHLMLGCLDKTRTASHFAKALRINNKDWRNWHALIHHNNQTSQPKEALRLSKKAASRFPDNIILLMDHATSMYINGEYATCLALLNRMEVLPYEGGWEAQNLFARVQIHLAMESMQKRQYKKAVNYLENAKTYPERLGTGMPYDPDTRLQDYLQSLCFDRTGDKAKSDDAKKRIYDYTLKHWESGSKHNYFGFLVLQEFKDSAKVSILKEAWAASADNPTFQWVHARLTGDQTAAQEIESRRKNDSQFQIVADVVKFVEKWKSVGMR